LIAAMPYTEDTLVQQTTAEYLENTLGRDSVYACNNVTFGSDGTLGRDSDHDVVLLRYLREKLVELNPDLPADAYDDAVQSHISCGATQRVSGKGGVIENPFD